MNGYDIAVQYAAALSLKFAGKDAYTVDRGQKYHRIVTTSYGQRSVHAFVDNDGRLIKAAGWKAPQKDKDGLAVRFNLSTEPEFAAALDAADPYGSYLYKR